MTEKSQYVSIANTQHPDKERGQFTKRITGLNALTLSNNDTDIEKALNDSQNGLKTLKASGGLQEMLAAQMLSIHRLQQLSSAMANQPDQIASKQYFTNAAVKLANAFVQQANLLSRLQGNGGQKIIVEHVEVHNGGQAVVGNINGGTPTDRIEK